MSGALPPLPSGYRCQIEPDGTVAVIEGAAVNGITGIVFVVGSLFAIVGVIMIAESGIQLANMVWGILFAGIGLPLAVIGGNLMFVQRRWRLKSGEVACEVGTWLMPLSRHSIYADPVAFEIRHQLTTLDRSVDLLILRTASEKEIMITAADNAPDACYKVFVWRGRQVGFDTWVIGDSSRRRPARICDTLEKDGHNGASLVDLSDEIAPRIVALANFFSVATLLPTTVIVEANHRRLFSIGTD